MPAKDREVFRATMRRYYNKRYATSEEFAEAERQRKREEYQRRRAAQVAAGLVERKGKVTIAVLEKPARKSRKVAAGAAQ